MFTKQHDFKTPFGRIMLESNELFRRNAKGKREHYETIFISYIFNHNRRILRQRLTEESFKESLAFAHANFIHEP